MNSAQINELYPIKYFSVFRHCVQFQIFGLIAPFFRKTFFEISSIRTCVGVRCSWVVGSVFLLIARMCSGFVHRRQSRRDGTVYHFIENYGTLPLFVRATPWKHFLEIVGVDS